MIVLQNKQFKICKAIAAAPSTVWEIVTDTSIWSSWGPSLADVECSERHIRRGSTGRVKTLFYFWLPFIITEYKHLHYWNWRVGPLNATGHSIIQTNEKSCTLCFDMPWWAFFYLPVCWLALMRINKLATSRIQAL